MGSPQTCGGARFEAAGPLAPDARLSTVARALQTESMPEGLTRAGYPAAEAHVIVVGGQPDADAAMDRLKEHNCNVLLSRVLTDIGIFQVAGTWRIVLAQPLLSPNLGDGSEAGRKSSNLSMRRARSHGGAGTSGSSLRVPCNGTRSLPRRRSLTAETWPSATTSRMREGTGARSVIVPFATGTNGEISGRTSPRVRVRRSRSFPVGSQVGSTARTSWRAPLPRWEPHMR